MLCYCKKCGRIMKCSLDETNFTCDCCSAFTYIVPSIYMPDGINHDIRESQRVALIEDLVKPSPEFNQYIFDHREEILRENKLVK